MDPRAVVSLLLLLMFVGRSPAAAPNNDKFAKPQILAALSGEVEGALVGATREANEPVFMAGTSVWYAFTAQTDGYFTVHWDYLNDAGGFMDFGLFAGSNLKTLQTIENQLSFDAETDRWRNVFAVQKGVTYRLVFDADVPGHFSFGYSLATGGGFAIIDPPRYRTRITAGVYSATAVQEADWRVREDAGTVTFTIGRFGSTEESASVEYRAVAGSAVPSLDYTGTMSGTLEFSPGQSRGSVTLSIVNNAQAETAESFEFELRAPSANSAVLDDGVTVTIDDDDGVPANDAFQDAILLPGASGTVASPAGAATRETQEPAAHSRSIWYSWIAPADGILDLAVSSSGDETPLLVYYGTSIWDIEPVRPLGYAAPAPLTVLSVPVQSGGIYHIAMLDHGVGGNLLNYRFSSRAAFRLTRAEDHAAEAAGSLTVTVERLGSFVDTITVGYAAVRAEGVWEDSYGAARAAEEEDFAPVIGQLEFASGESSKSFQIPIPEGLKGEPLEYFLVRLNLPPAEDNDDPICVEPSQSKVYIVDSKKPVERLAGYFSGSWIGLLDTTNGQLVEGAVQLTFAKNRAFTGSVILNGTKSALKGVFPPFESEGGRMTSELVLNAVVPAKAAPIEVALQLKVSLDGTTELTGKVQNSTSTAKFRGLTPVKFTAGNPAPNAGFYTVALTPGNGVLPAVGGLGFAAVEVKPAGAFKLVGALPDGTKVSGGGQVALGPLLDLNEVASATGRPLLLPFCAPLYSGKGSLSGFLQCSFPGDKSFPAAEGDGDGELRWVHPSLSKGIFKNPFRAPVTVDISRYVVPKGGLVLPGTAPLAYEFVFTGAGLNSVITAPVAIHSANSTKLSPPSHTSKATLVFNGATGIFRGNFTSPDGGKNGFSGAVLRNRRTGAGFFLKGAQSGKVKLAPTPP